jgi:hypothetical protein
MIVTVAVEVTEPALLVAVSV